MAVFGGYGCFGADFAFGNDLSRYDKQNAKRLHTKQALPRYYLSGRQRACAVFCENDAEILCAVSGTYDRHAYAGANEKRVV